MKGYRPLRAGPRVLAAQRGAEHNELVQEDTLRHEAAFAQIAVNNPGRALEIAVDWYCGEPIDAPLKGYEITSRFDP